MQTAVSDNRARVVMLRGSGEEKLQQAIASGLVSDEVQREIESIIAAKHRAEQDARYAQWHINELEKSLEGYKDVYFKALRAKQKDDLRRAQFAEVRAAIIIIGSFVVVSFLVSFLSILAFG